MNPNDSAFPQELIKTSEGRFENPSTYTDQTGLTVRAYIATKALQGILANPEHVLLCKDVIAEQAVMCADALIAELSKTL